MLIFAPCCVHDNNALANGKQKNREAVKTRLFYLKKPCVQVNCIEKIADCAQVGIVTTIVTS